MLSHYGLPFLSRLHRYVCAWLSLFGGSCSCEDDAHNFLADTPLDHLVTETPLDVVWSPHG